MKIASCLTGCGKAPIRAGFGKGTSSTRAVTGAELMAASSRWGTAALGNYVFRTLLTAVLLLSTAFAQVSTPQPARPPKAQADGQWHSFGTENAPARPPQNQPGHAGNWLRRYKDLPPALQRRALENDPQFRKLPPPQQERLLQKLQHFSSLPKQQQERILARMETWEHLTQDQKQRARQLFQQFRQLPQERRFAVNQAIRSMHGLTPDQRDRLIDSAQFRNAFSPPERSLLHGAAHLPLAPGDGLQPPPE
jgi:hypothetical protein